MIFWEWCLALSPMFVPQIHPRQVVVPFWDLPRWMVIGFTRLRFLWSMCNNTGVSLNGGTPISHPKMNIFSGKTMVVGYHHFGKPPHSNLQIRDIIAIRMLQGIWDFETWHKTARRRNAESPDWRVWVKPFLGFHWDIFECMFGQIWLVRPWWILCLHRTWQIWSFVGWTG